MLIRRVSRIPAEWISAYSANLRHVRSILNLIYTQPVRSELCLTVSVITRYTTVQHRGLFIARSNSTLASFLKAMRAINAMTTRDILIREIQGAPEDILQRTLRFLQRELRERSPATEKSTPQTTGPYADYWNQFIGAFADEEWERPAQGALETREAW